jgi:hypothetical protein
MSHPITPGRAPRRLLAGLSPLTRGLDRVELASRVLCLLVVLLAVPVALTVAEVAGTDARQRADEQAVTRSQVPAALLADAVAAAGSETGTVSTRTDARWHAPNGAPHEGLVPTTPEAVAGDTVTIWVDGAGNRVGPPLDTAGVVSAAVSGGLLTFLVIGSLAVSGHLLVCRSLWRRRERRWERAWEFVEPQWSGRC